MRTPRRAPAPSGSAAIGAETSVELAAPATSPPIAPVTEPPDLVEVRVISASYGHVIDTVERVAEDQVAEAQRLGWADPDPAAVAEARRLVTLARANQGPERRMKA